MIKLLSDLIDQLPAILVTITVLFFLWGIGYLITADVERVTEFKHQCIEAGLQYINGSCVK